MRGLTLVELMVVLAILAILSLIAYPLYENQVRKSRRAEAKTALMTIAQAQERRYTASGSYGTAAQLGDDYTEALDRMTDRNGDGNPDFYNIVVAAPTANTFTVTATAIGSQTADGACSSFVVNQLGQRTATGSDPDACW
jgi:type IV pilus assembly protein PilE